MSYRETSSVRVCADAGNAMGPAALVFADAIAPGARRNISYRGAVK
ncbi:hypothetical protein [Sphingorhabdus sp.]